jgi:hypothetical protein
MATKKQTVFLKNDKVLEQMRENIKIARKRRKLTMIQVAKAKEKNEKPKTLYAIDFLLGVYDENRMGALRFKIDPNGDFLDSNKTTSTPPWSSIRELQNAASNFENDENNDAVKKWLSVLMAPGSSLGGARPKANILDNDKKPYPKELLLRSKNYIVCV